MRRSATTWAVTGTLAVMPLAAACGGGDTAGPERAVSIGDVQQHENFYRGTYLGRTVTVSAMVSELHGARSFELSGGDFGDEKLLVVTDRSTGIEEGQVVRVTGTVGQLHESFPSETHPYVQAGLYAKHSTTAYLYDATVEPLRAIE